MSDQKSVFNWQLFIGFVLIVTGGLFLVDQFLEIELMRRFWPLLIVLLGLTFFVSIIPAKRRGAWLAIPGAVITTTGMILFIHNIFKLWVTWTYAWALLISAVGVGMLVMNIYLKRNGLRKAAGWVIGIGLILFVVFGILFEVILDIAGSSVNSGVFLGSGLVLLGFFIVFSSFLFSDKRRKMVKESPVEPTEEITQKGLETNSEMQQESAVHFVEDLEFSHLTFDAAGDIFLEQGSECGWTIEGDQELIDKVNVEVVDEILSIRFQFDEGGLKKMKSIGNESQLQYHVRVKSLTGLILSGVGNVHADQLIGNALTIVHSGEGQLILKGLDYQELKVDLEGLGVVELAGKVQAQNIGLSGLGSYQAENLRTHITKITVSGAGIAKIWVENELNATLDGDGSILFKGEPSLKESVTGSGSIKPL